MTEFIAGMGDDGRGLVTKWPGGYEFGDYWKYGLPIGIWWLVVVSFLVPLYWKF